MPGSSALSVRRDGAVLHVTLDHPATRNAMSLAMVQDLRELLAAAEQDRRTRVIVLRGASGHFCSGGNVADMAAARARLGSDPGAIAALSAAFGELCVAYARTGLAVVAVLQGAVMGGGLGLACVADVALAGESVVFRLPETSLGIVPAQIAPFLVERLGYSEAKRLAVTGSPVGAREALAIRLVHEVHEDAALDAAVSRIVADILRCAPGALGETKRLLARARLGAATHDFVHDAAQLFSEAVLGPEGIEGISAFAAKRAPGWAQPADAIKPPSATSTVNKDQRS